MHFILSFPVYSRACQLETLEVELSTEYGIPHHAQGQGHPVRVPRPGTSVTLAVVSSSGSLRTGSVHALQLRIMADG